MILQAFESIEVPYLTAVLPFLKNQLLNSYTKLYYKILVHISRSENMPKILHNLLTIIIKLLSNAELE